MLRSGYLATVGDQQLDNETLLQTSTQTHVPTGKRMLPKRHIHTHTQLFHDWSAFLSRLPGLEVARVVVLCWRVEWNSERVISPMPYQTPPQSISGSHQPHCHMEKLFPIGFLSILFLMGCWIASCHAHFFDSAIFSFQKNSKKKVFFT